MIHNFQDISDCHNWLKLDIEKHKQNPTHWFPKSAPRTTGGPRD